MKRFIFILALFAFFSCSKKEIRITNLSETSVGHHATRELEKYLGQVYGDVDFSVVDDPDENIQYLLSHQAADLGFDQLPAVEESFLITEKDGKVFVISPDERGL